MYKLSARQILAVAFLSAFFAAGAIAIVDRVANRVQPSTAAFSEAAPKGLTDPATATDEQNNIEVYRTLSPGVVNVHSTSYARDFFGFVEPQEGTGSGSVIDQDGNILTNYHVIEGATKLAVSFGGQKNYAATLVGGDPDTDLAVIRLTEKPREPLTIIPLGDSDKLEVGQKVLAIGNPFGLDRTLTTGVISGLQRPIRARNNRPIEGAIQTDASINPGNSGGPLLDSHGRMIGINSQILSPSGASAGVGFAVPVNIAKRIVPELVRSGEVRRPKLGIGTRDVGVLRGQLDLPISDGVIILQVAPGEAAANAGLRGITQTENGDVEIGDIIIGMDGEKIATSDDLYRQLDKHQVGDTVQLQIFRNGRRMTLPVKLTEGPNTRRGVIRRP
ncbi:MAG TPA: trypsin-like peptidase domain-containing protein [Pyrinomonadaceae bacterium]|nr:trypsin-like peptidase domain-containing protein [Pyrinomonadaceae bacterium]